VQRWVWFVPIAFVVSILVATDYAQLADNGLAFTVALPVATQLVGWGEEGMFRGIGVTALRQHGRTERKVALWSSVIFGTVHLTNAVGRGTGAIPRPSRRHHIEPPPPSARPLAEAGRQASGRWRRSSSSSPTARLP